MDLAYSETLATLLEEIVKVIEQTTEQQIAQTYSAALDSVNLINKILALPLSERESDWADNIKRNAEHLQQIAGGYYQVVKNLSICLAAIYQARSKPAIGVSNDGQ